MIRVPSHATGVMRYVARVALVSGRTLSLDLWCACPASLAALIADAEEKARASGWTGRLVNDPDDSCDLMATVTPRFGVTTFRGDVCRAGRAVEVVTFQLHGRERMIVAPLTRSSPRAQTEGRR